MSEQRYRSVCDDCGGEKRENHMGQSTHWCDYKQDSAEAAEKLHEILVEEVDYWLMQNATIDLTLHEGDETVRWHLQSTPPVAEIPNGVDTVIDVDSLTVEEARRTTQYTIESFDPPRGVAKFRPGYHGELKLFELAKDEVDEEYYWVGEDWVIDVEVTGHV